MLWYKSKLQVFIFHEIQAPYNSAKQHNEKPNFTFNFVIIFGSQLSITFNATLYHRTQTFNHKHINPFLPTCCFIVAVFSEKIFIITLSLLFCIYHDFITQPWFNERPVLSHQKIGSILSHIQKFLEKIFNLISNLNDSQLKLYSRFFPSLNLKGPFPFVLFCRKIFVSLSKSAASCVRRVPLID